MALLEALGVGTPAVVSPEVERTIGVSAGGAGWLSEPDDLSSLLERPEDLSSDEWARRSTAAKELAGRYNWSDVASAYEDLYREIIA